MTTEIPKMSGTLYDDLKAAGCQIDNHESDLYVKVDKKSSNIVRESNWYFTSFISQIDNKQWYNIPFAYKPWWDKRTGTISATH